MTFSIVTFSIKTLSVMILSKMTISITIKNTTIGLIALYTDSGMQNFAYSKGQGNALFLMS